MKKLFLSSLYANIFVRFINLWTGVLGARILGPYGRGELAATNRWTSLFILLFTLGLPGAVIYYGKLSRERQAEYIGAYLVLGTCIGFVGFAFGELMVPHLFVNQPQYLIHLARIAMISVPFGIMADGLIGNLITLNLFRKVLGIRVLGEVGTLLLILGLILVGRYTVESFIIGNLVWSITVFTLTLILVVRTIKPKFTRLLMTGRALFLKGLHIYSATVVSMFGANIDQLIISLFLTPSTLGLYAVSATLGGTLPAVISSALGIYLWPKLMDLPFDERTRKVERIHGVLFYATLAFTLVACAVIPLILPLIYGQQFGKSVIMTEVMLVSAPASVGYLVLTNFLSTLNKFNITTFAEVLGLGCGLLVTFPLIHFWAGLGAAIGVLVATFSKWGYVALYGRRIGLSLPSLLNVYPNSYLSLYRHLVRKFPRSGAAVE